MDYIEFRVGYQIVPYTHSGSNYYYAIINVKSKNLIINNYIFHSSDNIVEFEGKYNYSSPFNYNLEKISLSCKLMKYLNNKVIFCFYGEYNKAYYVILNITTFEPISGREGEIPITDFPGGMYYHSDVILTSREKIVCCNGRCGSAGSSLVCFGYNINSNEFSEAKIITEFDCRCEPIQFKVEYFPETEEFLMGCKARQDSEEYGPFNYYLGTFTLNFNFTLYNKIENLIPSECKEVNLFNIIYSSNSQKYSLLIDSPDCLDQKVINVENINSPKKNDYPTDETECNGYHTSDYSICEEYIPLGYFSNDDIQKILYKCHDNCKTCNQSSTINNNNCLTCKDENTIYFDLGNCRQSCDNGDFTDENNVLKCKCTKNVSCFYYTEESNELNLCVNCNNDEGYYIKSDEEKVNGFVNCYKNPEGYYLDIV